MIQKIENRLAVSVDEGCEKVDFTGASNIILCINQPYVSLEASGTVTEDPTVVYVTVSYQNAMKLEHGLAKVQLMWTDANGNKRATKPLELLVDELLKGAGYD